MSTAYVTAPPSPPMPPLPRRAPAVALFVFLTAAFVLLGRGTVVSIDERDTIQTSLSLLQNGSLAIEPGRNVHQGRDGRWYASREILPSLVCLPFCAAGHFLDGKRWTALPPVAPTARQFSGSSWVTFLTANLLGPLLAALTLLVLYQFLLDEGVERGGSLALVLTAAFATPLAVYAKTVFAQTFEAAWLMLAFHGAVRWRRSGSVAAAALLGLACGLGLMTRAMFVLPTASFFVYVLVTGPAAWTRRTRALFALALPAALGAAGTAYANWLRWGSPFDFGYHHPEEAFSTPLTEGLQGLLVSPGRGLFVFAPVLVLVLVFARQLLAHGWPDVLLALGITAAYLGVYGRWYDWQGGLSWGPRFLVPLIAVWVGLLGRAFVPPVPRWRYALLGLLALLGAGLQGLGLSVHLSWIHAAYPSPFVWENSYPVAYLRALREHGPDDYWLLSPGFWGSPVAVGLAAVWGTLLFLAALTLYVTRRPGGADGRVPPA